MNRQLIYKDNWLAKLFNEDLLIFGILLFKDADVSPIRFNHMVIHRCQYLEWTFIGMLLTLLLLDVVNLWFLPLCMYYIVVAVEAALSAGWQLATGLLPVYKRTNEATFASAQELEALRHQNNSAYYKNRQPFMSFGYYRHMFSNGLKWRKRGFYIEVIDPQTNTLK